ncbi:MAG TPA: TonB family protein [Anaeromyxobacter sp.]|nr:TonB family protein [Anaeromyxobacter sp.]
MPGPASRRTRVRERPRLRALAALLASATLNALVLSWLAATGALTPPRPRGSAAVALAPLDAHAWSENRRVAPPEPPKQEPRGRVIEQPPDRARSDRPPDDARFLSDRNARASRETVSRDAGSHPRPAPRAEPGGLERRPGARAAGRRAPADPAARPQAARPRAPAEGLAPAPDGDHASARPGRTGPPAPGATDALAPRRGAPDLHPSADALARIAGGAALDAYREAEEGDETWLSSREFRFATFLNQMRRAIGEFWYPSVRAAIRERDPEGKDVFYRERTVVLHLTLGPSGEVRRLTVAESSQVPFVDEIAVDAVRKAQPFANPPSAMFGRDGEARVPFAFTVFPAERGGVVRWRAPIPR